MKMIINFQSFHFSVTWGVEDSLNIEFILTAGVTLKRYSGAVRRQNTHAEYWHIQSPQTVIYLQGREPGAASSKL